MRIVAATNPDGSGNMREIERLLAAEPELAVNLAQLTRLRHRGALGRRSRGPRLPRPRLLRLQLMSGYSMTTSTANS